MINLDVFSKKYYRPTNIYNTVYWDLRDVSESGTEISRGAAERFKVHFFSFAVPSGDETREQTTTEVKEKDNMAFN